MIVRARRRRTAAVRRSSGAASRRAARPKTGSRAGARGSLEAGRSAYRRRAWVDAYRTLSLADAAAPLAAADLERLATCAYLTGREAEFHRVLARAHRAHLAAGDRARASRCAFWVGLTLLVRGASGQATGWLARARRLVESRDCAEQGYLLLPAAEEELGRGDPDRAHAAAAAAARIGERFDDADLIACARHLEGRALIRKGNVQRGLALLDEAMLSAVAGELSAILTGLLYCSVIEACQQVFASSRAREWTSALARWCREQPDMVAFTDTCLVRRAEILRLRGEWTGALAEASRAGRRRSAGVERTPTAAALYQRAEIHRLRGEFPAAEEAYRGAARLGMDPQPGLALLRLGEGSAATARAAVERALQATVDPLTRAALLPAHVEIALAAGDDASARGSVVELEAIASRFATETLQAMAAHARGALEASAGDARAALPALRRAFALWQAVEAPYEAARTRALIGRACRALRDEEAARVELASARAAFEALGAAPEIARLDSPGPGPPPAPRSALTARELQVLRGIAAGRTNRAIAAELSLSERTVDRHVSNILAKLDVPARAAAAAYASEHGLLSRA